MRWPRRRAQRAAAGVDHVDDARDAADWPGFPGASIIRVTSSTSYELLYDDGSKLVFAQPDYAIGTLRKVFLSKVIDQSGNALTFTYDAHLRLVGVTDAIGQVTVLSYELPDDRYKITKVTDPFGRFAEFDYDPDGRLTQITDVGGIASIMHYDGGSEFVDTLTTPYGVTSFTQGGSGTTRWIESIFPDGQGERVEFNQTVNIPNVDPAKTLPFGMAVSNVWLSTRNTFYWDKMAFAEGRGNYGKARIYHWLHGLDLVSAAGVIESIKAPLEGRVWYTYPGQTDLNNLGTSSRPANVGRVLDDGTTQLHQYEYNALGKVTKTVDPMGRTFSYVYADNGIDLLEVRQTRGTNNELLMSMRYDDAHRPIEMTDASEQTTKFTYNARGQLLTTTDPRGGVMTRHYDTDGYLTSIDGPLPGTSDTTKGAFLKHPRSGGHGLPSMLSEHDDLFRRLRSPALDFAARLSVLLAMNQIEMLFFAHMW